MQTRATPGVYAMARSSRSRSGCLPSIVSLPARCMAKVRSSTPSISTPPTARAAASTAAACAFRAAEDHHVAGHGRAVGRHDLDADQTPAGHPDGRGELAEDPGLVADPGPQAQGEGGERSGHGWRLPSRPGSCPGPVPMLPLARRDLRTYSVWPRGGVRARRPRAPGGRAGPPRPERRAPERRPLRDEGPAGGCRSFVSSRGEGGFAPSNTPLCASRHYHGKRHTSHFYLRSR